MGNAIAEILTSPPAGSLVASIPSPNAYLAYPSLTLLANMPPEVFAAVDPIWKRSILAGKTVNIYRLRNVFVVMEGLVFDEELRLIDVTLTYHTEDEVMQGREAARSAIEKSREEALQKGILAKSRGSSNYGHFLVEMLPRAWLARTRLGLDGWPAIVDSSSAAVLQVANQALQQAGFAATEIVATTHAPRFVEELIVVHGLTQHSDYLSPIVMQCLDAIAAPIPAGADAQVYAPRRPVVGRDFENEPRVAKRLDALGFREKRSGEMSFAEQVSAFKGAQSVVGVTGAALANIVFCAPGTRIFNFTPTGAREVLFWMIAEARRLRYREIRCPEVGPQIGLLPWDRAIRVSLGDLERILRQGAAP
jgi:capsular polysaccharide biosynthesis protein